MKPTLEQRFRLTVIGYASVLLLLIWLSLASSKHMRDLINSTAAVFRETTTLAALGNEVSREMTPLDRLSFTNSKKDYLTFKQSSRLIEQGLDSLDRIGPISGERPALARIRKEQEKIEVAADSLFLDRLKPADRTLRMRLIARSAGRIKGALNAWQASNEKKTGRAFSNLKQVRVTTSRLFIGYIVLLMAVPLTSLSLKRFVTRPLAELREGVKQITQGNLDHRLTIETGDEVEELAGAFNKLTRALRQEESTAADIQHSLLPAHELAVPGMRVVARQTQSKLIGGDWFDHYLYDNELRLMIADASGKGASGALLATLSMSAIRTEPKTLNTIEDILRRTNTAIYSHFSGASFVTLFSGQISLVNRHLRMISCGHEPPLHYRAASRSWSFLPAPAGLPLGVSKELFDPLSATVPLEPGDKLFLYTDGLHDLRDEKGDFLGMGPAIEWLNELATETIDTVLDTVLTRALAFSSGPVKDDVTLVGLEVLAQSDPREPQLRFEQ